MRTRFIARGAVLLALPLLAQTRQHPNSQSANPQNPNVHSYQNQSQNRQTNQKQNLSDLAVRMMNNAIEARNAVRNQDSPEALMYIGRASQDLNQLRREQPRGKLVPIYSELTDEWVLGPMLNARQGVSPSSKQRMNRPPQPQSSPQNRMQSDNNPRPGIAVHDVRGKYTGIWLDTTADDAHLRAAREALKAGNFQAADQALSAVQDSLTVETVAGDVPLATAREDFILAKDAARRGDQMEERAALRAASSALAEYCNNNGRHSSEAQQLRQQISQASPSSISADRINEWWNQVAAWYSPAPSAG